MRPKQLVILGCMVFLLAIVPMYLVLDRVKINGGYPGQVNIAQKHLKELEEKLAILENDLTKNHETINDLKNAMKSIIDLSGGKIPLDVQPDDGYIFHQRGVEKPDKTFENKGGGGGDWGGGGQGGGNGLVYQGGQGDSAKVAPQECTLATLAAGHSADVQLLDVYDNLRFDNPSGGVWKQGFDISYDASQWKKKPLRVIVVPHSHNDPGWIKTFNKYFTDQTQHILDNAVTKLNEYPAMKLIWAEISYLSEWWNKVTVSKREAMRRLILSGQLEIVTGGWVMNDEANTHYFAMLDQLLEGHEWMESHLGVKPKNAWAIDPFGMTPTMAYLLQNMGLNAMVIQRTHYAIKKYFAQEKNLEFMWRQNWDQSGTTDMFCHMMPFYSYDIPHTCGPDPKVCCQYDFKRLPGGRVNCPWKVPPIPITSSNVEQKAQILLEQYRKKSQLYRSNVLLVPLGDDFRYDKTVEWDQQYSNYMRLFDYMNGRQDWHVQIQFGTLEDYFTTVWQETGTGIGKQPPGFPSVSGDFFTYTDRDDHYWSGYYSSRPFQKHMTRIVESSLRAAEIIFTHAHATARHENLKNFPQDDLVNLLTASRRSVGLFQHHDAITGTAKDPVVIDYGKRLLQAIDDLSRVRMESMHFLMAKDRSTYRPDIRYFDVDERRGTHDALPTKRTLDVYEDEARAVVFSNSLAQDRSEVVRLLVSSLNVEVTDDDGNPVESQGNLIWSNLDQLDESAYELVFRVDILPLGMRKYWIKDTGTNPSSHHHPSIVEIYNAQDNANIRRGDIEVIKQQGAPEDLHLENNFMKAQFYAESGLLKSITTKADGKTTNVQLQFMMYGTTSGKSKSGAYIFLPDGPANDVNVYHTPTRVTKGPILSELVLNIFCAEHKVTLVNTDSMDSTSLTIENIVDIRNERNKELIMRLKTDIENRDKVFYTDLNGFQMQKRKTLSKLPIQGNFYPMPTMVMLEDDDSRFSVHSAQPLGVGSLDTGWVEIVLDRRLMQDDSRGLQQGVQDNKRTLNVFKLLLERKENDVDFKPQGDSALAYPSLLSHHTQQNLHHTIHIHHVSQAETQQSPALKGQYSSLQNSLPCDIHLLNLRSRVNQDNEVVTTKREAYLILHRKGFDCRFPGLRLKCSTQGGQVESTSLFPNLELRDIQSTSLSGTKDGASLGIKTVFEIEQMEIKTHKIKFH